MHAPTRRAITSRSEFHEAVRSAIGQAADAGAAEIWLCDATFADWPLAEGEVIHHFNRWAAARRRLVLLAADFDEVARRHARWSAWRRPWAHIVECRTNTELEPGQFPSICLVPGVISVQRFDPVSDRGLASHEPADAIACREAIEAVSQRSAEAFPVTTLGL
jgi:hypothetical protein